MRAVDRCAQANEMAYLYTVDFGRVPTLTLDASKQRNCAALINDYRGRGPTAEPNVRFLEVYVAGRPAILVDNFRAIPTGGQLLADYGEAFWKQWPSVQRRAASIRKEKERTLQKSLGVTASMVKLES